MTRPRLALLLVAVPGALVACSEGPDQAAAAPEAQSLFVDSRTCSECHAEQAGGWRGSHHDLAMQEATAATVLGDFTDTAFEHDGVSSRFFTKEDGFFVNTQGSDGESADFRVRYVFGVEPLQQYLFEFPGGRLQALTIAWDTEGERWFHLYPDEHIPAGDPLHWTARLQNWNAMCAECHSTHLEKNYDAQTDSYATTWEEIDVGCQTCHGPGAAHVDWAHSAPAAAANDDSKGLALLLRRGEVQPQLDTCAPCHSRRHPIGAAPTYGQPLLDNYVPSLLTDGLYHADGQILDEVYVYGSFVQSKMHQRGVTCTDCHDPHSLELWAPGNAVCLQCHSEQAPLDRFSTLQAKNYDTPEHHFHPAGTPGAQCVNCHMPERNYMVVDPRRDHSFRVPRPDLSVELGTPNACTGCHTDWDAEFAAATVAAWYPDEKPAHFATTFQRARGGDPGAEADLIRLARDAELPAIVRATAVELLRNYGAAAYRTMIEMLSDGDPLVRAIAVHGLDRLAPQERALAVPALLKDPVRSVRIFAARALAGVPPEVFDDGTRTAFLEGLADYVRAERVTEDMPWPHLNLARLAEALGRVDEAEQEYLTALRLVPHFLPARFNLATLYNLTDRNPQAEAVLRKGIELVPDNGELYYSFGLLLAEIGKMEAALDALTRASALLPDRPRVHYNLGLSLQAEGRFAEAETSLVAAHRSAPQQADFVRGLAALYVEMDLPEQARRYFAVLFELAPNDPWGVEQMRLLDER